ncbi:hypothetical protein KR51_00022710 [Rubidibacter lacunae KORDI 51-2]|uniref:Uncharacterized protein n=1 Tax=Rubidibacter lacunae KORDI 51-2 TaxID=582515 RepID=U5DNC9_9CHRO|nr:hypothetical protein [Rubidibacter lacunae]ERN41205.1 hypothetical protein KR51_00022710 [Rubidibacter lacunae KORDI 51-2]
MLVMLTDNRVFAPQGVCQSCLFADRAGQPRWRGGQLICGRRLREGNPNSYELYECQMGFRVAHLDSDGDA